MPAFVRFNTQFYILLNIPKLSIVLILNTYIQDLTEVRDLSLENQVYFRSSATKGHENTKIDKYGRVHGLSYMFKHTIQRRSVKNREFREQNSRHFVASGVRDLFSGYFFSFP